MSREPSHELHDLINSLTQTEKRYVKRELQRHVLGDVSQSELLFNAVAAQDRYNEVLIKQRFSSYGFVNRLPEAKRELVLVILRAMRQYHAERTPLRRAISGYADGEFLRSRGLFKWSERKFNEAARESELIHHHHLQALALYGLVGLQRTQEKLPEPTTPVEEDQAFKEAVAMQEVAIYEGLSDRMQALVARYGTSRSPAALALAHDLIVKGEKHLPITTLAAQNHWLRARSLKAFFIDNNVAAALDFDRSRLEVMERDERYRKANFSTWIGLVHSTALRLVTSGDVESARPLRDKLRNFWLFDSKGISSRNRRSTLGNYLNIELLISVQELATATSSPPIKMLQQLLEEYELVQRTELGMICHLNLGLLLFGMGRYREAVRQLNTVDDYPESLRDDTHRASRYIRILCHIEQEHESVVASLVRKEQRLLKGATLATDEEIFLNTAGRYLLQTPGKQRSALLRSSLEKLQQQAPARQSSITEMFAFESWLKAKLTNRTWREFLAD